VGTQPEFIKLKRESFEWTHKLFLEAVEEPADLYALIMSAVMINDLGKDPQLALDDREMSEEDISDVNHEMVPLKAIKIGLAHRLSRLSARHKADIVQGIELGTEFKFLVATVAQAENVPACLSGIISMKGQRNAFRFRFMEQLLDVASAAGHIDWTC
jgi:hypothetical protein